MNLSTGKTASIYLKRGETTTMLLENLTIPDVISVFSYPCSGKNLKDSIKSIGFINPILVFKSARNKEGEYLVICGAKRFYAARELELESIPVTIVSAKPVSEQEMFEIAFADNISVRPLNLIECAGVVTWLTRLYTGKDSKKYNYLLNQLELTGGAQSIEIYRDIYSLEDKIKNYLLKWNVSAGQAAKLTQFNKHDRKTAFSVIETLQLHGGKLKQFLELTFDICKREKKSIDEIINDPEVRDGAILKNSKITLSQKQAKMLDWLAVRRFPKLNERLRQFSAISGSMENLPKSVFLPPQNFEGERIRASLSFKSLREIDDFCKAVKDKANRERIQSLIDML